MCTSSDARAFSAAADAISNDAKLVCFVHSVHWDILPCYILIFYVYNCQNMYTRCFYSVFYILFIFIFIFYILFICTYFVYLHSRAQFHRQGLAEVRTWPLVMVFK